MPAPQTTFDAPRPYAPPTTPPTFAARGDTRVAVPTVTLADERDETLRRRAEAYIELVHWLDRL